MLGVIFTKYVQSCKKKGQDKRENESYFLANPQVLDPPKFGQQLYEELLSSLSQLCAQFHC